MKNVLVIAAQCILFLFVFFAGTILAGINTLPTLAVSIGPDRVFVYDGVLCMLALYAILLIFQALRMRNNRFWLNSTVALALAFAIGLLMKFGFKTV
jgi:hypothetical protein